MAFDEQAFMEQKRLEAEKELGVAIRPEDWHGGTAIEPDQSAYKALGLTNAAEREAKARLARRIKSIVRERGLKQQQVADRSGLSQSDVSKILRGQLRGFSESRLYSVIAALGYDVRVVVEFHERADHAAGQVELAGV